MNELINKFKAVPCPSLSFSTASQVKQDANYKLKVDTVDKYIASKKQRERDFGLTIRIVSDDLFFSQITFEI